MAILPYTLNRNKMTNEFQVYVGTYHKYNCGSLHGAWIDLFDHDIYSYCDTIKELHKDEHDPEYMVQDTSVSSKIFNILIDKLGVDNRLFDVLEYIIDNNLDLSNDDDLVKLHNDSCDHYNLDNYIYSMDDLEEVINMMNPYDAFNEGIHSNICWSDNYYAYDGYGHIKTISSIKSVIDEYIIADYLIDQI